MDDSVQNEPVASFLRLLVTTVPSASVIPVSLLIFGFLLGHYVRRDDSWWATMHSLPPRLALCSTGILGAAAVSPHSAFRVALGDKAELAIIPLLILYLIFYVNCESACWRIATSLERRPRMATGARVAISLALVIVASRLTFPISPDPPKGVYRVEVRNRNDGHRALRSAERVPLVGCLSRLRKLG